MKTIPHEECRRRGHEWDDVTGVVHWEPPFNLEPFVMRCVNCKSIRLDGINAIGQLGLRRYEYPEDWRMTRDEMPSRETLRREWAARQKKARRAAKASAA